MYFVDVKSSTRYDSTMYLIFYLNIYNINVFKHIYLFFIKYKKKIVLNYFINK